MTAPDFKALARGMCNCPACIGVKAYWESCRASRTEDAFRTAYDAGRDEQRREDAAAVCNDCRLRGEPRLLWGTWAHTIYYSDTEEPDDAVCSASAIHERKFREEEKP